MQRPVSVGEAATILGVTQMAVLKRIATGKILARKISNKGYAVCRESVDGSRAVSAKEFERECGRWISVPEACDIVCVTDGMIIRMLNDGRLDGFRLNDKCWAVSKKSAEANYREALERRGTVGAPRRFGEARRPKKRPAGRSRRAKAKSPKSS